MVDVFYRGRRIGGGDGSDPRFRGHGGVFNLEPIVFDVAACRWPLVIVARNLRRGEARDSFGIATFQDGGWTNGGCAAWPSAMIRGLGSGLNDSAYVERMSLSTLPDAQAWAGVGVRVGDPWARGLGSVGYQQIYDASHTGCSFSVAATLPFCQGSSLE